MDIKIINRQNCMVYKSEDFVKIKTSYKSVKVNMDEDTYKKLINILRCSIEPKYLNSVINSNTDMKIIKMLYELGCVFLYKSELIDSIIKTKWFNILNQYLPSNYDLLGAVSNIIETKFVIRSSIYNKLPKIKNEFEKFGLTLEISDDSRLENGSLLITDNKLDISKNRLLVQSFSNGIAGTFLNDLNYNELENIEHRLIFKFAPLYILIFCIKKICGLPNDTFFFNETGKFLEFKYDNVKVRFTAPSQSPIYDNDIDILSMVQSFELSDIRKFLKLSIANQSSSYANIRQVGFSTYGILNNDKEMYLIASKTYELAALNTIVYAVKKELEKFNDSMLLVTTSKNYYVDKILLLLQGVVEETEVYRINNYLLRNNEIFKSYYKYINNVNIYLSENKMSGTFVVYLEDENLGVLSSDRKVFNFEEEVENIILNYILLKQNNSMNFRSIYNFKKIKKITSFFDKNPKYRFNRRQFIENALTIFKKMNIVYDEMVWDREIELNKYGLIFRSIVVGEYEQE